MQLAHAVQLRNRGLMPIKCTVRTRLSLAVSQAMQAAFGPAISSLGSVTIPLVSAAPNTLGCVPYAPGTSFKGQAVLIQRGTCGFALKAWPAYHASMT